MRIKAFITVILTIAAIAGASSCVFAAPGKISGFLEWRYGEHSADEGGAKVLDASHFTQKYSFLWQKEGRLKNGRLGKYDLSLGYEWSWVDAYEGNHQEVVIDNPLDKILYSGDVTISPGGLPFSFHAYSRDLQSTTFVYSEQGELFDRPDIDYEGGTVTSIRNGTARLTGFTLIAGTKNGHYKGKYRDLLSALPKLLIDYSQIDAKDVKGPEKFDYIDRNLAFVSLNKKNNWFHYRAFTHTDRIDDTQSYQEQTYLLGTIDHTNRRQWINLTNWIKVSSDISYEETANGSVSRGIDERYNLNLFARAERTRWDGSTFTTYQRVRDENSLDKTLFVPFYAQGELNRDTSWRFRTLGSGFDSDRINGSDESVENVFVSGRVNTFQQARYLLSSIVEAESKDGTEGRGVSGRLGGEFYSNSKYRSPVDIYGSLDVRYYNGTSETDDSVDYIETAMTAKIEDRLNSLLLVGIMQSFAFGEGPFDSTVSDNINSVVDRVDALNGNSSYRSTTTAYTDFRSFERLNNRFTASFDHIRDASSTSRFLLAHNLSYDDSRWSLTMNSQVGLGESVGQSEGVVTPSGDYAQHTTNIRYAPTRSLQTRLRFNYSWRDRSPDSFDVDQDLSYAFWTVRGRLRRFAEVGEKIRVQNTTDFAGSTAENYTAFTLFGNLYPTVTSLLGARIRYERDKDFDTDLVACFLTAGLNFKKFKLSVDYSYGQRESGSTVPERNEQRWEVKVKKLL